MTRRPRLYFSLRSPYSWLTVRRLRKAVPAAVEQLEWFPYWDPDERTEAALRERGGEFHYLQMSRAKHLYMLLDTKRLAQREGLKMAWPVDTDPWWELPHLAWLAARLHGKQWEFYDAIMVARWGRADDICQPAVVRAAAEQAGLDPATLAGAPDDPDLRRAAVDCLYQAYLDDVFGIPYLKWGSHRFWGYDRLDAFLSVWQPRTEGSGDPVVAVENAESPWHGIPKGLLDADRGYDADTAGGCG